jgi:hypothetical protein
MAKNIQAPDDVQIPSMRVEQERIANLLTPGEGTPWEDRGAIGFLPAFFKTVLMSMKSPGKLLQQMRRPETAGDTRVFVLLCGLFWGISWVIHDVIAFKHSQAEALATGKRPIEFDPFSDGELWLAHFALGILGTWILLSMITRLFYKLVAAGDAKLKFPQVLCFNVYAYCLGPSILALIPFYIGPAVAFIWILGLFIYGASNRLAIKTSGAIICNLIAVIGVVGLGVGVYFLAKLLLSYVMG